MKFGFGFLKYVSILTPAQLFGADLVAWHSADSGVTGTASVTSWDDLSGNGRTLSGISNGYPSYSATGFNGRPSVHFVENQFLEGAADSFPALGGSSGFAVFIAGTCHNITSSAATSGPRWLSMAGTGQANDWNNDKSFSVMQQIAGRPLANATGFWNLYNVSTAPPDAYLNLTQDTPVRFGFTFDGTTFSSYLNGGVQNTTTPTIVLSTVGRLAVAGEVGSTNNTGLNAYLGEIVIVKRMPTPSELTALDNHFSTKWGL